MRMMIFQFSKKTIRWHFLWYGIPCFLITKNFLFWVFWRWKIRSSFWPKSWWKYGIYWLLKSSCFELYEDKKYDCSFLSQIVDGTMIITDYWKFFALNFSEIENTVFFWVKKFMERWYLLVTGSFLF